MKGFKYSCFISYRSQPIVHEFVAELARTLDHELSILLDKKPVFFDAQGISTGMDLQHTIGKAIRQSACYVVIYTPTYLSEEKPYCAAELLTMFRCEEERAKYTGEQDIIFPIALRGADRMPDVLRNRVFLDFSRFISVGTSFRYTSRYPIFAKQIARLAEEIAAIYRRTESAFSKTQDPAGHLPLMDAHSPEVLEFVRKHRQELPTLLPQF